MKRGRVGTVGFFDGLHQGHQFLIAQLLEISNKYNAESVIVTMFPHPLSIINPASRPQLLTTLEEKNALMQSTGVDHIVVLPFNEEIRQLSASDFMNNILKKQLHLDVLIMGYNHRFGCDKLSRSQYSQCASNCGMQLIELPSKPGTSVSSTLIRQALLEGDVFTAQQLMGRPYEFSGQVVTGFQVGRTLGYPTANLKISVDKLIPAHGVYAVWVYLTDGSSYMGMLNIGNRPTLNNGDDSSIEVHLIGFQGNLYEQILRVQFMHKIRNEQHFDSMHELQLQLSKDCSTVHQLLG